LKAIIAAGGTGGHIFPGIAVARELLRRDPGAELLFMGTPRGLESKIVPREGFKLETIRIGALKGKSVFEKARSLLGMPLSFVSALSRIRRFGPDVVIGSGGYASGPVLLTAALLRIPTMLIEPNAMPGFTNRVLARFVDAAALSFAESSSFFRGRAVVTGNPVRGDFATLRKKARGAGLNLLVFGGSQGAHAINAAMIGAASLLKEKAGSISIVHQTGEADFEMVKAGYANAGFETAEVRAFIHEMFRYFEQADVLICRSGATTAAEVAASGKAVIFVPFPFATDDHQRKNAEAFQRAGAGRLILQQDLTPERLARELIELSENPKEIDRMEEASRKLGKPDAAERAVDLALSVASGKGKK
jgi:UDP-N-acetylglucosamine--N-acetylmuramyl-(pentapeptide) pyrophosphoryl-undecaprenol N-acetylglucosamine transferase